MLLIASQVGCAREGIGLSGIRRRPRRSGRRTRKSLTRAQSCQVGWMHLPHSHAQPNLTVQPDDVPDAGFFFRDVHACVHILASAASNGGCGCVGAMPSAQPTGRIKPSSCKCSESSAAPHGAARHPSLGTRATFRRPPRAPNPLACVCSLACSREGARSHHRYDRAEPGTPTTPQTLNLPCPRTQRCVLRAVPRCAPGQEALSPQRRTPCNPDATRHVAFRSARGVSLRTPNRPAGFCCV